MSSANRDSWTLGSLRNTASDKSFDRNIVVFFTQESLFHEEVSNKINVSVREEDSVECEKQPPVSDTFKGLFDFDDWLSVCLPLDVISTVRIKW